MYPKVFLNINYHAHTGMGGSGNFSGDRVQQASGQMGLQIVHIVSLSCLGTNWATLTMKNDRTRKIY